MHSEQPLQFIMCRDWSLFDDQRHNFVSKRTNSHKLSSPLQMATSFDDNLIHLQMYLLRTVKYILQMLHVDKLKLLTKLYIFKDLRALFSCRISPASTTPIRSI